MHNNGEYIHPDSIEINCLINELHLEGKSLSGVVEELFLWFDNNISYSRLNAPYYPLQRSDLDVLKLYCAFRGDASLLTEENVFIIYDRDMKLISAKLKGTAPQTEDSKYIYVAEDGRIIKVCVHYPSYRRSPGCRELDAALPWKDTVESC